MAPLILCVAVFGADYTSENAVTAVQAPFAERATEPFEPPTISASDAERLAPLDPHELKTLAGHVGEIKTVRGKCTAAFVPKGGTVVVLNFDVNYREALTAPIFEDHFAKWPGGAEAIEEAYVGKTLLIEGLVTEYRDAPQIKIAHPGQVRVIESAVRTSP